MKSRNEGNSLRSTTVTSSITKSFLATESLYQRRPFQETTRVLTEGAVTGKKDHFTWLERKLVVVADTAGTGLAYHMSASVKKELAHAAKEGKCTLVPLNVEER